MDPCKPLGRVIEYSSDRDRYPHFTNKTPSIGDPVHQTIDEGNRYAHGSPTRSPLFQSRKVFLRQYKTAIEGHVDRRVQLFFAQMMSVYNQNLQLVPRNAQHQSWSGVKHEEGAMQNQTWVTERSTSRQSAHSSVLPCLIIFDAKGNEIEDRLFLSESSLYRAQNSCLELPTKVNQTDTWLDGDFAGNYLRSTAFKILRLVTAKSSKTNPIDGLGIFLQKAVKLTSVEHEDGEIDLIRRVHKQRYQQLLTSFVKTEKKWKFLDDLHGVHLPATAPLKLRGFCYSMHAMQMRHGQAAQSVLNGKIEEGLNSVMKDLKRTVRNRPMTLAFDAALLDGVRRQYRPAICRLTSYPGTKFAYPDGVPRSFVTLKAQIAATAPFKALVKELNGKFLQIKTEGSKRRGKIFRQMGAKFEWKDVDDLVARVGTKFGERAKKQVEKAWNAEGPLSPLVAAEIAAALQIPASLFNPDQVV